MAEKVYLGGRVRRLREGRGLTQAGLARDLGVSPSYLNLIEHDQRPLTVPLLLALARQFDLDLTDFSGQDETRLVGEVREVLGDTLFDSDRPGDSELVQLVSAAPGAARAMVHLYRAWLGAKDETQALAERVTGADEVHGVEATQLPSDEVSEFIQRRRNHFPALEAAAEELRGSAQIEQGELRRGLIDFLANEHGVRVEILPGSVPGSQAGQIVRRYDPEARVLGISEILPPASRVFQLAHQLAFLRHDDLLNELVGDGRLSTPESKSLARVALANYFASAVAMPYEPFLAAARDVRYDVELLEHRFRTSFEQVCHRLTSLARPGAEGVPLHLVRIDIAGNVSKKFTADGLTFARFGGACPRWNVHGAFLTPGQIRTQVSEMPDGSRFFCFARTVRKAGGGHGVPQSRLAVGLGCRVEQARELVYSDSVNLENAVPVGASCRLCDRLDCRQRAFPPVHHRLDVDENRRGLSFYYTPPPEGRSGPF
jgi:predicted transcriptional regulator/DNA-binding XRE family transcriptional regulator